ncbi:DUF4150 domain-containing protein [Paracoccus pacificus]|uniref:DUF4150 domain-containing protein n=1 Tax=Paracoccus pacificus TaxID=1463598 RepID=A0ABW4R6J4_9RHOB
MKETVTINGLTLCHKASDGFTMSTIPDVCRSPGAPIPYVNVAFARDLDNATTDVFSHGGEICGVRGSRFRISYGDEPGRGKGVKSNTVQDEATWLSWSPNVYLNERAATRLTDRMLMNHGNAASLAGYYTNKLVPNETSYEMMCRIGCFCYAGLRPRTPATKALDAVDNYFAPVDEDVAPGRYQRCVEKSLRAIYPDRGLAPLNAEKPWQGDGYIPEVGFWDPTNPDNIAPTKPPGQVIFSGGEHDFPRIPRRAPWQGYKWFNVRGSRWMDVVKVDRGNMTEMYDMKFPGDKANNDVKDRAYRTIARKHRAKYEEFWVLERCKNCEAAIQDYEWERQRQFDKTMRDIIDAMGKAPIILPGPGGRIPIPVPKF